jgi:hypothetical protein
MADIEQQTPIEGTPAEDVEMDEGAGDAPADASADVGGETTLLPEIEPEPKLILFAE